MPHYGKYLEAEFLVHKECMSLTILGVGLRPCSEVKIEGMDTLETQPHTEEVLCRMDYITDTLSESFL